MNNHVHLLVRSEQCDSLARTMKRVQSEYAFYVNRKRHQASGHLWQSRFYSCPVEGPYVWMTLRYIELNPVRAHIAESPEEYPWSSARYHLGKQPPPNPLEFKTWQEQWSCETWREALRSTRAEEAGVIRTATQKSVPLGSPEFVRMLEENAGRTLVPRSVGRPNLCEGAPSD